MFRMNSAFKKLQRGEPISRTAYEVGFESISGFGESFKNIFGVSPLEGKRQTVINLKRLESTIGTLLACSTSTGVCLLEFTDRKMLETELKALSRAFNAVIIQGDTPHLNQLESELNEYFSGTRTTFAVPLDVSGTAFQQKVWEALQRVPYGETRSYKQQAEYIDHPKSVRAVANANGMNRIAILIPCHRIIGSDGELTGYGGGLWWKQYLLELEKRVSGRRHSPTP